MLKYHTPFMYFSKDHDDLFGMKLLHNYKNISNNSP